MLTQRALVLFTNGLLNRILKSLKRDLPISRKNALAQSNQRGLSFHAAKFKWIVMLSSTGRLNASKIRYWFFQLFTFEILYQCKIKLILSDKIAS